MNWNPLCWRAGLCEGLANLQKIGHLPRPPPKRMHATSKSHINKKLGLIVEGQICMHATNTGITMGNIHTWTQSVCMQQAEKY